MKTVCKENMCAGCMACVEFCAQDAIKIVDSVDAYNAVIQDNCVHCNMCQKMCPVENPIELRAPIKWYQGWALDETSRMKSSSGGFAAEIEKAFLRNEGVVYSCIFEKGKFCFKKVKDERQIEKFRGSKYVKSNPYGIYKEISQYLKKGKRVLFVGLPCQVAGCKRFVGEKLGGALYTIDLICHGTPSPQMLEMFLEQYGLKLKNLTSIKFRQKGKFGLSYGEQFLTSPMVRDCYTIGFLKGLFYTENCYYCRYAQIKRVGDLTIGDSWGSELPALERQRGISLALCQNMKGIELLDMANLHLEYVNIKNAISSNHQLQSPTIISHQRNVFIDNIKKGKKFNAQIKRMYPKICIKQDLKSLLRFVMKKSGGGITYNISIDVGKF